LTTENNLSRKNTTRWNLFFLYLRAAIGIINGILIVPLYLYFIKSDLYGAWLATGNILIWFTVVDPGVGEVMTQKVSVLFSKHDYGTMKWMFSSAILISFIVTLLALIGSFGISFFIPDLLRVKDSVNVHELILAFRIMALGTACTLFSYSFAGILLGFQLVKFQGIVQVIAGILGIIINIVLLYAGFGLYSIAIQYFFRGVLVLICYFVYFIYINKKRKIGFGFNRKYFIEFSKVFSYTWIAKIVSVISENIDLIIVSRYIGPQFVTILEMTRRPLNTLSSFINMPSVAILPAASHLFGEGNIEKVKEVVFRFLRISFYIAFLVSFGFMAFNKDLVGIWLGEGYFLGTYQNLMICAIFLLSTINFNLMIFSFSFGNIKGNSIYTLVKSVFYISLLYFAAKHFGIPGILVLAFATATIGFFYFPRTLIKILHIEKFELKRIILNIIILGFLGLVLAIPFSYLEINNWYYLIMAALSFGIIYISILWLLDKNFKLETKIIISKITKRQPI